MAQVHPTAIVSDEADLADDVVVGPWSLIEGPVRVEAGTRMAHRVSIRGPVTIGERNEIYPNVILGYPPQDKKFDHERGGPGVVIGNDNVLREGVSIHRATGDTDPTRMGDDNYLMVNAHLGHDVQMGSHCMMANNTMLGGHVQLADGVIMGGGAAVHQFCRVGRLSILSGITGIAQDMPPFCTVYMHRTVSSLNLVGLRRAGYREHIENLQRAFDLLYTSGLPNRRAVEAIESECGDDPLCRELAEFVSQTKRGITPYASSTAIATMTSS